MSNEEEKKYRLKNLRVNEVSLVDTGANNRKFAIVKAKTGDSKIMGKETQKSLEADKTGLMKLLAMFKSKDFDGQEDKVEKEDEDKLKKGDEDSEEKKVEAADDENSLVKILSSLKAYVDKHSTEKEEDEEDPISMEKDGDNKIKELVKECIAKLQDALLENDEEEDIELSKADDEEVEMRKSTKISKSFDLLKAKNITLEKKLENTQAVLAKLEKEAENRKLQEFVAIAKKDYAHLGGSDELGAVLKSLSESDPKAFKVITKTLVTAKESLAKSDKFNEIGSGASNSGNALSAELENGVQNILKAKGGNVTKADQAQALEQVLNSNPQLYNEYLKSRNIG